MNPSKSLKPRLISQISNLLNLRFRVNQQAQFNIEKWNRKKNQSLKLAKFKNSNQKNEYQIWYDIMKKDEILKTIQKNSNQKNKANSKMKKIWWRMKLKKIYIQFYKLIQFFKKSTKIIGIKS